MTLPEKVNKYGFEYRRVAETSEAYIYAVFSPSGTCGFDVFKRIVYPRSSRIINGLEIIYGGKEAFPPSSAFGSWAWHCMTLEQAQKRLNKIA